MSGGEWGLIGVVIGGLITASVQSYFAWLDRKRNRRVAARVFYGHVAVAEAVCDQVIQRRSWPDLLDFGPSLATWTEFRAAFGAGVTALEWTHVGVFYSNLERFALMVRHGQECTDGDIHVAEYQRSLAKNALTVTARHTARTEKEQQEIIEEIGSPMPD